jgi:hypothetical protein
MNAQWLDGTDRIVAKFAELVKSLCMEFATIDTPGRAVELEERIRSGGREILAMLLQERLQAGIERSQMKLRECSNCGGRHRHRGVRARRLASSVGTMELNGIYWHCPDCGHSLHSVDVVAEDRLSGVLKEMVLLLGVSCSSFAKGELLAGKLLGIEVDDDTLRRTCETEGQVALNNQKTLPTAGEGELLWGSCDGTMVNTREDHWREVKAARFRHSKGDVAMATLDSAEYFLPQMAAMARSLLPERPGPLAITSDCAEWITKGVHEHLPGWKHIADYWHVCQHIHKTGECLYGEHDPRARSWSQQFSRQLREQGAEKLADLLRPLAMDYPDPRHQRAVLDLAKFLDKHASRMEYPQYIREGLPVDSGAMESLCKQLGLRMKGAGMRWSVKNVSSMACLVARWAVDPKGAIKRGLAA